MIRGTWKWMLIACFVMALPPSAGAAFSPGKGLGETHLALVSKALNLLPPGFETAIQDLILIEIDPAGRFLAKSEPKRIVLGSQFLQLSESAFYLLELQDPKVRAVLHASAQNERVAPHHATVEKLLIATLLHEMAHVYDLQAFPLRELRSLREGCSINSLDQSELCQSLSSRRYALSDGHEFLNLAGWPASNGFGGRWRANFMEERSPDVYEWANPQEAFAVNFEYFLLDPEYKCRRPDYYRFYSRAFSHDPHQEVSCGSSFAVLVNDSRLLSKAVSEFHRDRLYAVDYLVAGPGEEAMSRWGHAMIRFVFCPPSAPMSESCRHDTRNSLVLSFRGMVDEYFPDTWKGFTGRYDSVAYFYGLENLVEEYANGELRDLISYPLALNAEERSRLLSLAVTRHWTYRGKYYFLTNNCAVETLNLIKAAFPEKQELQSLNSLSPVGLRDQLMQLNLIREESSSKGYRYPSKAAFYRLALNVVASHFGADIHEMADYRKKTPSQRDQWVLSSLLSNDPRLLAALYLVHLRHFRMLRGELLAKAIAHLPDSAGEQRESFERISAKRFFAERLLGSPGALLKNENYGLPDAAEIDRLKKSPFWEESRSSLVPSQAISDALLQYFTPDGYREIQTVADQLREISAKISSSPKPHALSVTNSR